MYRELHLSSTGRTGGDHAHPRWELQDEIELSHFCLRNVQFPRTWDNVPFTQYLVFYKIAEPVKPFVVAVLRGNYTVASFAAYLQTKLRSGQDDSAVPLANPFTNFAAITVVIEVVDNRNYIRINFNAADEVTFEWPPEKRENQSDAYRIMGSVYGTGTLIHTFKTGSERNPYPMNLFHNRYFFLRSNALTGSRFTANVQIREGSFNSGNIIAKIPLNTANVGFDEYENYSINDSPSLNNMFKFDGSRLDKMDLYFTDAENTKPIDFGNIPWSATIGILGPCN